MLESTPALADGDVVVRMARSAVESARWYADAGREFVQFLEAIRHEVEPREPARMDLGVIDVHHLLVSPQS